MNNILFDSELIAVNEERMARGKLPISRTQSDAITAQGGDAAACVAFAGGPADPVPLPSTTKANAPSASVSSSLSEDAANPHAIMGNGAVDLALGLSGIPVVSPMGITGYMISTLD